MWCCKGTLIAEAWHVVSEVNPQGTPMLDAPNHSAGLRRQHVDLSQVQATDLRAVQLSSTVIEALEQALAQHKIRQYLLLCCSQFCKSFSSHGIMPSTGNMFMTFSAHSGYVMTLLPVLGNLLVLAMAHCLAS